MTAFSTLNVLPPAQLTNLNELGYLTMTPVQAAALPAILAGKDVRVQAKTGSGKTAAHPPLQLLLSLLDIMFKLHFRSYLLPLFLPAPFPP